MNLIRTVRRGVVTTALAALIPGTGLVTAPAHADEVICGQDIDLQTDHPLETTAGWGFDRCLPGLPTLDLSDGATCTYYRGVDITIGWLSGTVRRDLLNGDTYYVWSAPVDLRINSDCHDATVSYVTYTDRPNATGARGRPLSSRPFRKQQAGRGTVSQAPKWEVLYYGLGELYTRATSGELRVMVEPAYVDNGVEYKMAPWEPCKARTFFFTATPNGPHITHARDDGWVVCPGWE